MFSPDKVIGGGGFTQKSADVVLHLAFKSQKFSTKPVELTSHPNFTGDFCFTLSSGDDTLNNLEELLTTQSPLKIILTSGNQVLSTESVEWRHILRFVRFLLLLKNYSNFSSTTRDVNEKFHGTNAERSMVIGQCQLKLQLIPGFIRKSIEAEIIETQFSLESSRNVEQDKIFMFRVFLVNQRKPDFIEVQLR